MMRRSLVWLCMFLLFASAASAATARIIQDFTAPGCIEYGKCNVLTVSGDGTVVYTFDNTADMVGGRQYSVSFAYKVVGGSFEFKMDGIPESELAPVSLNYNDWVTFSRTFTMPNPVPDTLKLRFTGSAGADYKLDELQLTESPEPTRFNNFDSEVGCCPFDYCWTGGALEGHTSCVHSKFYEKNVSMPPIGWNLAEFSNADPRNDRTMLDAQNGYRCINGSWKFSRIKYKPLFDGAGYCPEDDQCFIGGSPDAAVACVGSGSINATSAGTGEPAEWFYCDRGNWTTRTKEIALQLLNMANKSPDNVYTIFCDRYDRSLNPDETFTYYRDYLGENIVSILTSGLVEEFCVMDLNGQVIAGVSLTEHINGTEYALGCAANAVACLGGGCGEDNCPPAVAAEEGSEPIEGMAKKSFIEMLKGPSFTGYCDAVMQVPENFDGYYHDCDGKDVYYNPKLMSVIFSKPTDNTQAVPLEDGRIFIEVVFDYLRELIRNILGITGIAAPQTGFTQAAQLDFVKRAGSFDKLYISYSPDGPVRPGSSVVNPRAIRAIRETRYSRNSDGTGSFRTFLSAEYANYQSDICDFFFWHNDVDVRRQISRDNLNIQCNPVIVNETTGEWMHSIFVEEPVFELTEHEIALELDSVRIWIGASDTFWNDVTAKIRTQRPKDPPSPAPAPPAEPGFIVTPSSPIAGTVAEFNITSESGGIIARTWHFGDGQMSSSAFNITTRHVYSAAGNYDVKLCVMDSNYRMSCHTEPIVVGLQPQVLIEESQTEDSTLHLVLTVTGGTPPYNIQIDWNDTHFDDYPDTEGVVEANHLYALSSSSYPFDINVSGRDDTGEAGLEISGHKRVVVRQTV